MDEGEAKIMAKEVEDAEKEMRAAKARLRRLCETKSNGKLKVPAWLHEAWKSGDKGAMAEAYKQTGYDKDFGEASRYGGEPEYWVSTRETGSRTQEEKIVEMRKTTSQDGLKR
ncbi:unnamed protein product [Effrenium voratum]|nr:unnamed protein product [Effrenium voratum]